MPKIKPCQAERHMPLTPAFVKQGTADPKFKANTTLPTVYLGTINKLKIWVVSSFIFVAVSLRQVSAFPSSSPYNIPLLDLLPLPGTWKKFFTVFLLQATSSYI